MSVEIEILAVTKQQPQAKNEDLQRYLYRVALAVNKITNQEWDCLSDEARDWFNRCCDARYALPQTDLPLF